MTPDRAKEGALRGPSWTPVSLLGFSLLSDAAIALLQGIAILAGIAALYAALG